MAETQAIITTLKQALREHSLTYADVAIGLQMSEANVKRMFASERITLDRIEAICGLMDFNLSDLFQLYERSRQQISQLTEQQEKELVTDTKLMIVFLCARNELSFEEILQNYHISKSDLIRCLAKLDHLKILDLLPNNKFIRRIDQHFSWIPNGPIERFYEEYIQGEFLTKHFKPSERQFVFGLLGENSIAILQNRLQALASEFVQLHHADSKLPWEKRKNSGLLMVVRQWDPSIFAPYRKQPIVFSDILERGKLGAPSPIQTNCNSYQNMRT